MMQLVERANTVLSPVLGHYTQLEIERGEGPYLIDFEGNRYLDFGAGIAVASTGHCHPKVVNAIHAQSQRLIHACAGVAYYSTNIDLADQLGKLLGQPLSSVFFTQSGTEAVEAAIKLAKYTTKKQGLISFKGGFHGRTLGALSVTTSKEKYRQGYDLPLDSVHVFPYPYFYRFDSPYNQLDSYLLALDQFFDSLDDSIAAAIIEPVLGEGGYVPAPPEVLRKIQDHCCSRNILLIFDEIQTGFGRTGKWFSFHHTDVMPDIVTLAKGIASGLPLGACVASPELMSNWTTGAHGGTYGGNPVTCAAALATIEVVSECLPDISRLGTLALDYLNSELSNVPYVGDIRGQGLMIGIELVRDSHTQMPASDFTKDVMNRCLENKLIVLSCGIEDNVLRLMPPLIVSEDTLMNGLSILVQQLKLL